MSNQTNQKIRDNAKHFYQTAFPNEGNCPQKALCDKNKRYTMSQKPKEAYIGANYGANPAVPKLLFLSLDAGKDQTILEAAEQSAGDTHPMHAPKNGHWYRTFEIAQMILEPFAGSQTTPEAYYDFYAHTNSAKCNQNRPQNRKADWYLFANCKEYVKQEIIALEADIIVTQGNEAAMVLNGFDEVVGEKTFETTYKLQKRTIKAVVRKINGRQVIHIQMMHPTARSQWRSTYFGQKKAIADNKEQLKLFVQSFLNH
jgi:hypothetical protein